MAKLSENQVAAVAALRTVVDGVSVAAADKNAWKKATPQGVTIVTQSMINAGAVTAIKAQIGGRTVELYAPVRPTSEVGGVDSDAG